MNHKIKALGTLQSERIKINKYITRSGMNHITDFAKQSKIPKNTLKIHVHNHLHCRHAYLFYFDCVSFCLSLNNKYL